MVKPETIETFTIEYDRTAEESISGDVAVANNARRRMAFYNVIAEMIGINDGDNDDETVAPDSLTKAQLIAALENKGIVPKSGATKAELIAQLNG